MGSLQLSDNDVAQLWSELESGHQIQLTGGGEGGGGNNTNNGNVLPTLEEDVPVVDFSVDVPSRSSFTSINDRASTSAVLLQVDQKECSAGAGGEAAAIGNGNAGNNGSMGNIMHMHGNKRNHDFLRSYPMGESRIDDDRKGFYSAATIKAQLDRTSSLPADVSSDERVMKDSTSASTAAGTGIEMSALMSMFDPVDVSEKGLVLIPPSESHLLFRSNRQDIERVSNAASTPAESQEFFSRHIKDGHEGRYNLSSLDKNMLSNSSGNNLYARMVTVDDMSAPLSRMNQQQSHQNNRLHCHRSNDGGSMMLQKASSAPVLGNSTFGSNFALARGTGSPISNMGNSDWKEKLLSSNNNFNNLRNSSMGLLQGEGLSRTSSGFSSNSSSRMNRVQSDGNETWSTLDSRHQNRNNQRKSKFLSLSRPSSSMKQQQRTQQFFSMDETNALHIGIPTAPRCDYVDFSMIDDTKVTDETPIYGQTYESILRNPDVSIVQNSDVVVVPGNKNARLVPTFPKRLMVMLNRPDVSDVITWLPHGRSFIVRDPKKFEEDIYPRFFKPAKYKSFQRQLNLWKFLRINKGFDAGSYYHPLFLRGKPQLGKKMVLPKNEDTDRRSTNPNKIEPDFYSLAKVRPLPDLPPCTTSLPPKYSLENTNTPLS